MREIYCNDKWLMPLIRQERVGIYNSEMSKYLVGYKYDTLDGGFSNRGLITRNKKS